MRGRDSQRLGDRRRRLPAERECHGRRLRRLWPQRSRARRAAPAAMSTPPALASTAATSRAICVCVLAHRPPAIRRRCSGKWPLARCRALPPAIIQAGRPRSSAKPATTSMSAAFRSSRMSASRISKPAPMAFGKAARARRTSIPAATASRAPISKWACVPEPPMSRRAACGCGRVWRLRTRGTSGAGSHRHHFAGGPGWRSVLAAGVDAALVEARVDVDVTKLEAGVFYRGTWTRRRRAPDRRRADVSFLGLAAGHRNTDALRQAPV